MALALFKFLLIPKADQGSKASDRLVGKLQIPDYTKHFVLVIREPETRALIYILCVHGLSERSARDIECLIRAVRPDAVLADGDWRWARDLEPDMGDSIDEPIPTSAFRALKQCFMYNTNKHRYIVVAENWILEEILGACYYKNYLVAKRTAEEVGSAFLMISPYYYYHLVEPALENPSRVYSSTDDTHQNFEPLLLTRPSYTFLHEASNNYGMSTHLARAQKMLIDIDTGGNVEANDVCLARDFQIRTECLRLIHNRDGRYLGNEEVLKLSELSSNEILQYLVAEGIKDQAKEFNTIVAVVDATRFRGFTRFWNSHSSAPPGLEMKSILGEIFVRHQDSGVVISPKDNRPTVSGGPALAVATAVLTASTIVMKKQRRIIMPWVAAATCTGLFLYGDAIVNAPSVARLGRGIQNLRQASQAIDHHSCRCKIDECLEALIKIWKH